MAFQIVSRRALKRLSVLAVILAVPVLAAWLLMIRMPGKSWSGPLPPLTEREAALAAELRRDVERLAGEIGERNVFRRRALAVAARFLFESLSDAGYRVERQAYEVHGVECENFEVEIRGAERPEEIVVVGGHYDSVDGSPGANDNATGVAATLALARAFAGTKPPRTLRFVLFVNEEPPWFQTGDMGSAVYARRCRERGDDVTAMLALETIGYYSDEKGTQSYPPPLSLFYPSRGNFIGIVGNVGSRRLVKQVVASFRRHARFPSEGAALPSWLPGVGWSDHWAFFREGYPAVMVTDTAPFRYPHYHLATDTPDKVDYERTARVVVGLAEVIEELTQ
ncbi:MAG: M28 family peptidase [Planctomycetota bacterium]|jgi:hypothetical protein